MILITGATGQLGTALVAGITQPHRAVSRPEVDFTNTDTIDSCFDAVKPTLVINAAAYTAVDAAETDVEGAKAGNHTGPAHLARLCAGAAIPFIHVSTDYVFDGAKGAPYLETDPTNPTGVYGRTKRDGELAVLQTGGQNIILRTAWVYSATGKNFCKTILNAGRQRPELRVVADQRGTPTAAADLAAAILAIVARIQSTGWADPYTGIFHATNAGETTWHGFATAIWEQAAAHGLTPPAITPIATSDWPTPACRPADSRLDCTKLNQIFSLTLPEWQQTLPAIVTTLLTSTV
jgi:dTDP-4-dehydrorhamnose reductase